MALVSNVSRRLSIPNDAPEWVEVRSLGWAAIEKARSAHRDAALQTYAALFGENLPSVLNAERAKKPVNLPDPVGAALAAPADPLADLDLGTVLQAGIVRWSYEQAVSSETIGDLDEETARWLAREIVAPTKAAA